eukprot:TRINITY_DN16586_c0_g1_i2.p1 TRINITY_DN16586_c0_g1~~TRINITY_DN16586_c0_g1_i2.p1  ORF type:complete len:233 (-),score=50.33 TRINITY_DN16586_c0_g1_i2:8-706(-)
MLRIASLASDFTRPSASRGLLAVSAAVLALLDPYNRADMVAALSEVTSQHALERLHARMGADADGLRLLRERPVVRSTTVPLARLAQLPRTTFGGAYAAWLSENHVTPDSRSPVRNVGHPEHAYVLQRYRETHDMWHVLAGLPTSVVGEVAVKWFECAHLGLPMTLGAALVGPVHLSAAERSVLVRHYVPWALRCGASSRFLLAVPFEDHFDRPLAELRQLLNFEPAPQQAL